MAKLLKHLGLGHEKPSVNICHDFEESPLHGRYRRISSNASTFESQYRNRTVEGRRVVFSDCNEETNLKDGDDANNLGKVVSVMDGNTSQLKKVVILEDYSDPVDAIRGEHDESGITQSDIYCDPQDCQPTSTVEKHQDSDAIYDLPPDDDYTDPYESNLADVIRTKRESQDQNSKDSEEAIKAFSFLDGDEPANVIYDLPPDSTSDDAVIYDSPPHEGVVYDMPWEWTSSAHLRSGPTAIGDRTSLSSHDSSGSQNSVGSAGSSSSVGRRRQVYETAFDSVLKTNKTDDIDRKIQHQTNAKHSDKVLVNIAPKEKRKVTLLRNDKPQAGQLMEVKASIEHNNSLGNRTSKIRKSKHHSFSDFDQLKKKINQNEHHFDVKTELKGMTEVIVKTALQKEPSADDYELPWDYNKTEQQFRKMAITNICDRKTNEHEAVPQSDIDYDKPWDLHATKMKFENLNKESSRLSGSSSNMNCDRNSSLPANQKPVPESSSTTELNNTMPVLPTPSFNINNFNASSTGAVPKTNKDQCPPIIRPKMTLDFNQGSRKPRQNLNLNFGCSALGAIGEKIDISIPLQQQGWYHGSISRFDAENLLRVLKEGSYLVRNSESCKQDFSLSLKSAKGFMHMKIVHKNDKFILGQFSKPFNNIPQMIQHYSMNKLPIRGAEHMSLLYPVIDQLL